MIDGSQPSSPAGQHLRAAALMAWLLAIHLAYYAAHKPVTAVDLAGWQTTFALLSTGLQPAALMETLGAFAVAAVLSAVSVAAGAVPARTLTNGDCSANEALCVSGGFGVGILGTLILGLSAVHILTPPAVTAVVATLALFGVGHAAMAGRWWKAGDGPPSPWALWRGAAAVVLTVLLVSASVRAAAPPTGWDALVYHLTGPQHWLRQSGFVFGLDLPHTYFPALMEHCYAAAMALHGDRAAQLLHTVAAVLTVLLTVSLAERWVAPGAGLLAAAGLMAAASLTSLAGKAYVDWTLMLFATAALWAALRLRLRPSLRAAMLTGVLCGLAAATKYTAVGPILGIIAVAFSGKGTMIERAWMAAVICTAATVVFVPWALRDVALTGNPVYPFVFGGWNWDAWRTEWYSRPGSGLALEPWRLLTVPWEATVAGAEGSPLYDGTIGPIMLALLPATLLAVWRSPSLRPFGLFAAVVYAVWLLGVAWSSLLMQVRLLYPAFPALAVLSAAGLLSLREWSVPTFRPQRIAAAALALDVALAAAGEVGRVGSETVLPVLAGSETRQQFQRRALGEHAQIVGQLDVTADKRARVLFLWEPRTYLCPVDCGPDALLFNFRDSVRKTSSPAEVAALWRAHGYTHVLVHGAGLRFFTEPPHVEMEPPHIESLQAVEGCCLERLHGPGLEQVLNGEGARYTLYRLKDAP